MMQTLNPQQETAITHGSGPMMVLAGPGSGKTTVIIHRVRRLILEEGCDPRQIMVITFTKAAAQQMKKRFLELQTQGGEAVSFGTFHSVFFRILRYAYGYSLEQIMHEEEKWNAMRKILQEVQVDTNDEEEYIRSFLSEASFMKNELQEWNRYEPKGLPKEEFQRVYKKMEQYKAIQDKLDFDDMLVQCYELLSTDAQVRQYWQQKIRYLLIDEFQDINKAQYECIRLLLDRRKNLFVVGDDDQSIYCFRGARPDFLLNFPIDFLDTQKVILDTNYRSTEKIIRLTEKIIRHNQQRFPKGMKGTGNEGEKIRFFTEKDTAAEALSIAKRIIKLQQEGISLEQIAIIYRTNLQGNLFAQVLQRQGIPYVMKDKAVFIYRHWIAKDIMAYLLFAQDETQDDALRRVLNKPTRYITKEMLQEAEKMPYPLLRSFYASSSLSQWKEDSLNRLQLDMRKLKQMSAQEGVSFIRKTIGYDRYLEEYSAYRKASLAGFLEIANEITEAAKQVDTIEEYLQMIQHLEEAEQRNEKKNTAPKRKGVVLSTMHSAKGLEFDAVFLPSLIEGIVPYEKSESPAELEEERRLFYVAASRARNTLFLSDIQHRYEKPTKRSRFLRELGLRE